MILHRWHTLLGMQVKTREWHAQDIADELAEWREACGIVARWSELADVVYTVTRARYVSEVHLPFPLARRHFAAGLLYMFPKYTLRWLFFRSVGKCFGVYVKQVRNPKKVHKLSHIARKYDIDEDAFVEKCKKRLPWWPLIP